MAESAIRHAPSVPSETTSSSASHCGSAATSAMSEAVQSRCSTRWRAWASAGRSSPATRCSTALARPAPWGETRRTSSTPWLIATGAGVASHRSSKAEMRSASRTRGSRWPRRRWTSRSASTAPDVRTPPRASLVASARSAGVRRATGAEVRSRSRARASLRRTLERMSAAAMRAGESVAMR